jgi:hypothetical protein
MQRLLISIEERWPGRLTFTNEAGQKIEPPAFLGRTDGAKNQLLPSPP